MLGGKEPNIRPKTILVDPVAVVNSVLESSEELTVRAEEAVAQMTAKGVHTDVGAEADGVTWPQFEAWWKMEYLHNQDQHQDKAELREEQHFSEKLEHAESLEASVRPASLLPF